MATAPIKKVTPIKPGLNRPTLKGKPPIKPAGKQIKVSKTPPPLQRAIAPGSITDLLPTNKTTASSKPESLRWLAIAPAGWGKTELFTDYEDSLLLAFEEGYKFIDCHKIVIDCFDYKTDEREPWKDADGALHMSFIQAVEQLENNPNRFRMVVIDTVDMLIKQLTDFTLDTHKAEHLEDMGTYGKGYDIGQNTPFRRTMSRILKTGRGVAYLTHQQVNTAKFKKGEKSKKESTLPSGIWKQLVPQVDIVIHGELGSRRGTNSYTDRIIVADPSEDVLAKNRGGVLPPAFILPFSGRWKTLASFFTDPKARQKALDEYDKHYERP